MFGLGMGEGFLLFLLALLLFGGKKLPALGSAMGSAIRNFKQGLRQKKEVEKNKDEDL